MGKMIKSTFFQYTALDVSWIIYLTCWHFTEDYRNSNWSLCTAGIRVSSLSAKRILSCLFFVHILYVSWVHTPQICLVLSAGVHVGLIDWLVLRISQEQMLLVRYEILFLMWIFNLGWYNMQPNCQAKEILRRWALGFKSTKVRGSSLGIKYKIALSILAIFHVKFCSKRSTTCPKFMQVVLVIWRPDQFAVPPERVTLPCILWRPPLLCCQKCFCWQPDGVFYLDKF